MEVNCELIMNRNRNLSDPKRPSAEWQFGDFLVGVFPTCWAVSCLCLTLDQTTDQYRYSIFPESPCKTKRRGILISIFLVVCIGKSYHFSRGRFNQ